MRKILHKNLVVLATIVALVGLAFLLAPAVLGPSAQADDSYRTTGLTLNSYDFDDDGTPDAAISAAVSTTLTTDTKVKIETWYRPSGQNYVSCGSTWADRVDNNTLWVTWKYPQDEFNSGTEIKVTFTCHNSGGQTFSYDRTVFVP